LGRIPLERRKNQQALSVGGIALRGVVDVFTGGYHCFALVEKKGKDGAPERQVYSWGKNNWGQLGHGTDESTHLQHRVLGLPDAPVRHIVGGEDHTLFLLESGEVYGCGRNDDHQLGPIREEDVRQSLALRPAAPQEAADPDAGSQDDGPKMDTVTVPVKLQLAEPLDRVFSSSHYNIAAARSGQFYSWGLGFSYVLGNGRDEEVREPHAIKPEFFKHQKVACLSLGGSHVMYTTGPEPFKQPELAFTLEKIQQPRLPRVPFPHRVERDVSASIERKAKLKAKQAADASSKSPSRKSEAREAGN
jgi:regulator of chromosome condensation